MTRNTRLSARYWSWVKRLGEKKALVALGHTLLRIVSIFFRVASLILNLDLIIWNGIVLKATNDFKN